MPNTLLSSISPMALESEKSIKKVSETNIQIRRELISSLRELPEEAFSKLRYIIPQTGCLNRCSFCSQNASASIFQLNQKGLENIFASIKTVALEVASKHTSESGENYLKTFSISNEGTFGNDFTMPPLGLVGFKRNKKAGVLYCYLDNDVGSYPYLDKYLELAKEDLGMKVRISTVGYSRNSNLLQNMHERIAKELSLSIYQFRFSYTPYTYGWTTAGEAIGNASRKEFLDDFANALKTYKPLIKLGRGDLCTEIKFKPLVVTEKVTEERHDGHHVIHAGPYLLISKEQDVQFNVSKIVELRKDSRSVFLDSTPLKYEMIITDALKDNRFYLYLLENPSLLNSTSSIKVPFLSKTVDVYLLENADGKFYSIEPQIKDIGVFSKEIYPISNTRPSSGYIDSERYFLNALLEIKKSENVGRREQFYNAKWEHVDLVIDKVEDIAFNLSQVDNLASKHISNDILPLIRGYAYALKSAGLEPAYFFDKSFTVDTGGICNIGRAFNEFKGLTTKTDTPLTPQQERAFGHMSYLAEEGTVWMAALVQKGGKAKSLDSQFGLLFEKQNLEGRTNKETYVTERFTIPLESSEIEYIPVSRLSKEYLIPGQILRE